MLLQKIQNKSEFDEFDKKQNLVVVHFMAEWAPQCEQMNDILLELAKQDEMKAVTFANILAEDVPEVSKKYEITAVPTFIILREGKVLERVDGANGAELTTKIKTQAARASLLSMEPVKPKQVDLNSRLKKLINSSKCMLFMKGSPDAPKCGFSQKTIDLLNKHKADFSSFDILTDDEVRQGLKTYSNWPTYPQLYVDGELIGGLDILNEMESSEELSDILPKKISLNERLKKLTNQSPLMIFMKGEPSGPRCGFSKQIIAILNETELKYDTFDILSDEEVRQGLKTFSNWPTYPQIYVKGELIGGLDIINDLKADGSLISTLKRE